MSDAWDRMAEAQQIIDANDGRAYLSGQTLAAEHLIHWKTAERLADKQPNTYVILRAPGGHRIISRRLRGPLA